MSDSISAVNGITPDTINNLITIEKKIIKEEMYIKFIAALLTASVNAGKNLTTLDFFNGKFIEFSDSLFFHNLPKINPTITDADI